MKIANPAEMARRWYSSFAATGQQLSLFVRVISQDKTEQ